MALNATIFKKTYDSLKSLGDCSVGYAYRKLELKDSPVKPAHIRRMLKIIREERDFDSDEEVHRLYVDIPYCGRGRPPASNLKARNELILECLTSGEIQTRSKICGKLNKCRDDICGRRYKWTSKKQRSKSQNKNSKQSTGKTQPEDRKAIYPPSSITRILKRDFKIPLRRKIVPPDKRTKLPRRLYGLVVRNVEFLKYNGNVGKYIAVVFACHPNCISDSNDDRDSVLELSKYEHHFFALYDRKNHTPEQALKKFHDSFVKEYASVEFADVLKEFSADIDDDTTLRTILKRQADGEDRENKKALEKGNAKAK